MRYVKLRQVIALLVLTLVAGGLVFGTIRIGGLVFGAGSAVGLEASSDLGLPETLAFPAVEWQDPGPMSELVRERVAVAYQEAWTELVRAHATGEHDRLDRFFTGPALAMVRGELGTGGEVFIETGFHQLSPGYLHPEEWLIQFTDRDLPVERRVRDITLDTTETYHVVMVIERGRWMIHSLSRAAVADG